jgi:hypothetical protein
LSAEHLHDHRQIRLFALQPLEPSNGYFALRKLMADGSNGSDTYPFLFDEIESFGG